MDVNETAPPRVLGLGQVAQHATDLDASVAFYRDVVGLRLIARFDPPGLAFFDLGGVRLLLEANAPATLLYLQVGDIEAARAEIEGRGGRFDDEVHMIHRDDHGLFGPPGVEDWMTFITDPAGNLIALMERRPAA